MFKRLLVYTVMISTVFLSLRIEIKASDWPERNLNQTLNRHIIDPSLINSSVVPFSIEVAHNTQDVIAGGGYVFYSDGLSQSTVYAVNMLTQSIAWSKQYPKQVARIVYNEGKIYFGADKFYCLRAYDGYEMWATSPGKFGSVDYYTRIYQYDEQYIYGFRYYSNMYKLAVLDKLNGAVVLYSEIILTDFINDVAVWQNKLYITIGRSGSGGSQLSMFDLSSYTYTTAAQTCRSNGAKMIIDGDNNQVVLTASNAAICSYRLDNLAAVAVNRMINLERYIKYNDRYYSVYGEYSKSMPANNTLADVSQTKVLDPAFENFQSDPLIVNEHFFAGTSKSGVWSKNLETGQTKYASISAEGAIRQMIYASGCIISLIGYGTSGDYKAKIVFSDINNLSASPTYQISVTSPYNTAGMNQYLGQLHCHYVPEKGLELWNQVNNGSTTPEYTVNEYKKLGYDFVALTEHNRIVSMPVTDGITQIVNAEEDTQGDGGNHILALGIGSRINEDLSDQERINQVVEQDGFAILAHPNSRQYGLSISELLELDRYHAIETFNAAMYNYRLLKFKTGDYSSFKKADKLFTLLKDGLITASDDYTPGDGGIDGGAVVVYAPSNTQADIMAALKNGNFYAVQGSKAPRLDISYDEAENIYRITSNELSNIKFIGRDGKQLQINQNVSSAEYQVIGNEVYVRAEVESVATGKKSWTQALFVSSRANISTLSAGSHLLTLSDAQMSINTSSETTVSAVPFSSIPKEMPPAGYLANIYSLETLGTINNGTSVSYSYKNINLPVSEEDLSIYTYDESSSKWQKILSVVDTFNKTVTANLTHFSLYTLSAEAPEDAELPTVSLISPSVLDNIHGTINIQAEANDNQAVTSVSFILDNNLIGNDLTSSDGYYTEINADELTVGRHTLLLQAEDFAGNIGEQEISFEIVSGVTAPSIEISNISENQHLYEPSDMTISYQSTFKVENINISIDDIVIGSIKPQGSPITKNIAWKDYVAGSHTLKLELWDVKGNIACTEKNIIITEPVTAEIISPHGSYMTADTIAIDVASQPADTEITITIDGTPYTNNSTIQGYKVGLGQHILEVKVGDKILDQETFSIDTSYGDTIKLISQLYTTGKIKNLGLAVSLICKLKLAETFASFNMVRMEKKFLDNVIDELNKAGEKKIGINYRTILFVNIFVLGV